MFHYSRFAIEPSASRPHRIQTAACRALKLCALLGLLFGNIMLGDILLVDTAHADHLPPTTPVLPGSDHSHEDHSGADYTGLDFSLVDFSAASLRNAILLDTLLDGARFVGADMHDASLWNATITQSDFTGADLSGALLRNMQGTFSIFVGADLSGVDMDDTHLQFADMRGVNFNGANLSEFTSLRTNFRGADLSGALQIDAHTEAIYDSATLLPPGFDPVNAGWVFVPEPATSALAICAAATFVIGSAARRRSRHPAS